MRYARDVPGPKRWGTNQVVTAWSRHYGRRLRLGTNEFLNVLHGLRQAGGKAIGLRSLETSLGFVRVAAESPNANHHFEFWEPRPDLLEHGPRRRERVRRQRRDADYVVLPGFQQCQPVVG